MRNSEGLDVGRRPAHGGRMSDVPKPDYTPVAVGRRFPRCAVHGVHTLKAVRAAPEGDGNWGLLCPGPEGGRGHVIPVREPERPDRFPLCRLCGAEPEALRPNFRKALLVSFTLVGCGHTVAVPWLVAVGLV